MTTKRLFLFASYDKDNLVDPMLEYYLRALSKLGDIVFIMDNPLTADEMEKITDIPNVLYSHAEHHGEYDFGSYKRAYQWAKKNKRLYKYDWVYFVNDSVLGPLFDLEPVLKKLESNGTDVVGMFDCHQYNIPEHIQSWFIGITGKVACTKEISKFIDNIRKLPNKNLIITKYEIGFSQLLKATGCEFASVACGECKQDLKAQPAKNVLLGVPFFKKSVIIHLTRQDLDNLVHNKELLEKINFYIFSQQIELPQISVVAKGYQCISNFKLFNCVPILHIYRRDAWGSVKDKYVLFGFMPIFSITRR